MANNLTPLDICLLVTVSLVVIVNICMACCIGLVLPKHLIQNGYLYTGDLGINLSETLREFCYCKRDEPASKRLSRPPSEKAHTNTFDSPAVLRTFGNISEQPPTDAEEGRLPKSEDVPDYLNKESGLYTTEELSQEKRLHSNFDNSDEPSVPEYDPGEPIPTLSVNSHGKTPVPFSKLNFQNPRIDNTAVTQTVDPTSSVLSSSDINETKNAAGGFVGKFSSSGSISSLNSEEAITTLAAIIEMIPVTQSSSSSSVLISTEKIEFKNSAYDITEDISSTNFNFYGTTEKTSIKSSLLHEQIENRITVTAPTISVTSVPSSTQKSRLSQPPKGSTQKFEAWEINSSENTTFLPTTLTMSTNSLPSTVSISTKKSQMTDPPQGYAGNFLSSPNGSPKVLEQSVAKTVVTSTATSPTLSSNDSPRNAEATDDISPNISEKNGGEIAVTLITSSSSPSSSLTDEKKFSKPPKGFAGKFSSSDIGHFLNVQKSFS